MGASAQKGKGLLPPRAGTALLAACTQLGDSIEQRSPLPLSPPPCPQPPGVILSLSHTWPHRDISLHPFASRFFPRPYIPLCPGSPHDPISPQLPYSLCHYTLTAPMTLSCPSVSVSPAPPCPLHASMSPKPCTSPVPIPPSHPHTPHCPLCPPHLHNPHCATSHSLHVPVAPRPLCPLHLPITLCGPYMPLRSPHPPCPHTLPVPSCPLPPPLCPLVSHDPHVPLISLHPPRPLHPR